MSREESIADPIGPLAEEFVARYRRGCDGFLSCRRGGLNHNAAQDGLKVRRR